MVHRSEDPEADRDGQTDRAVVGGRLRVDDAVQTGDLVQDQDQRDEDYALTADRQDQGRQRFSHTLDRVDAEKQDAEERAGKLQGDDHLHTVGDYLRVIDEGLDDKAFCHDHDGGQDRAHDDRTDAGEAEHLEQTFLVARAVVIADQRLDAGAQADLQEDDDHV